MIGVVRERWLRVIAVLVISLAAFVRGIVRFGIRAVLKVRSYQVASSSMGVQYVHARFSRAQWQSELLVRQHRGVVGLDSSFSHEVAELEEKRWLQWRGWRVDAMKLDSG